MPWMSSTRDRGCPVQGFGLKHYAGQVWYNVDGFLDKNRDTLRSDVVELLISSKIKLISSMFENFRNNYETTKTINKANGRFVTMKPRTPTVAARFHDSLQQLLGLMDKCNPWFVRCIKPNNEKAPMKFDMPIVIEQLRYTGMLETIRIRKTGYPIRLKFSQFFDHFRYIMPDRGTTVARGTPYRELCRYIMEMKGCNSDDYQLGTTRIFLRENLERELEKERSEVLHKAALTLQTNIRGYLARRKYHNIKKSAVKLQAAVRGWSARKKYKIIRKGVIATQAKFRGKRQRQRYLELKEELKRRAIVEKAARDRAKVKAQKEEQERTSRAVAGVNHLEIPAELAFIFSKLDDWEPAHTERNLVKVVGNVSAVPRKYHLPQDIDYHAFTKFTNIYFKSHVWGMKREPIKTPFLAKAKDIDYQDSLAIFKLILRFMNDNNLSGKKETVLGDYIVNKGLSNEKLRDEILCQLCNQTWNNTNDANNERGWLLMANCLSVFPPSGVLYKYLLKYVSDHAYDGYKALCQRKLLEIDNLELPLARSYPPSLLEWRSNRKRVNMALPLQFSDGETTTVSVDSWTTSEELAGFAIRDKGIQEWQGWSVALSTDQGVTKETTGCDYVMDLISEMEVAPAFPVCKNSFLLSQDFVSSKNAVNDDLEVPLITPRRPVNPPPQPPVRKQSHELLEEAIHAPRKPLDRIRSQSKDHTMETGLSRKSALNDRYFEDGRSRSLDNLLDSELSVPRKLDDLGLSRSRLNDRYHSVDKIATANSIIESRGVSNQEYMTKAEILLEENLESVSQRGESHRAAELNGSTAGLNDNQSDVAASSSNVNIDFDYQDITARSEDDKGSYIKGHPRFIKSQYAGKRAAPGSHSSRAYIEKSDYTAKSSALSDTSEAPSLASHVRRVRVPSQASDVDQFLDDLFMPVLDGNLDELSDARSLAASIKGGGDKKRKESGDYDQDDFEVATLTSSAASTLKFERGAAREAENVEDYITNLFQPIFVNDSLNRLTSARTLAQTIKGGGRGVQNQSSGQPGFTPITNMTSPATVMPGMMSPTPMMMPLFTPTGLNLPNQPVDTNLLAYQQNLQRAFLQSAMAQNIQIQQQLLAQNQALQQLLQQQTTTGLGSHQQTPVSFGAEASEFWLEKGSQSPAPPLPPKSKSFGSPITTTTKAQVHRAASPVQQTRDRKSSFNKNGSQQTAFTTVMTELKTRKSSQESVTSKNQGIPAPPPLPPPPDSRDPHNRSFIDSYGRAKTVRIGKWRWPPPQDESQEGSDSFLQFKLRQQRKTTPQKQQVSQDIMEDRGEGIEWEEFDMDTVDKASQGNRKLSAPVRKESKDHKNSFKAFEVGAQRPTPGSIGKLRISSEMRHKLEMVTANHSVRSTTKSEKPSLSQVPNMTGPKKLEDNRRLLLEQQLAGRWGSVDSIDQITRAVSKDDQPTNIVRSQVERMEKTSPPAQTKTPNSHWRPNPPPAPVAPPTMENGPQAPSRSDSFYSTSHTPITRPRSPPPPIQPVKRSQFNNTDMFGNMRKESFGRHDFRSGSRRDDMFDDPKDGFNNIRNREGVSAYKRKIEMDRRSSGVDNMDRIELEESSEFLQPVDIPPPTAIQRHQEVAETRLHPQPNAAHFTYNRIPWKLHVRKEVFSPVEKLTNPLAIHLIFCQIVKDVLASNSIRITREQRASMKKLLDGYGITMSTMSSQSIKQTVKKNVVELAKEWGTYFCRLYPVSGGQTNRVVQYLGVSHSGIRLIRREKTVTTDYLQVLETVSFDEIAETSVPKSSAVEIVLRTGGRLVLYSHRASQIQMMIMRYIVESEKGNLEYVRGITDHIHRDPSVLNFRKGEIIKVLPADHYVEKGWLYGVAGDRRGTFPCDLVEAVSRDELITAQNVHQTENARVADRSSGGWTGKSPASRPQQPPGRFAENEEENAPTAVHDGKHSLLQFAIHHFRQSPEKFEMLKTSDGSISGSLKVIESKKKNKEKGKGGGKDPSEWTWKEQVDLVKFTAKPIEQSLLRLETSELNDLAVECFVCLMRYMGDLPMPTDVSEVKCVYTILMHCHKFEQLRDEVYCQLMKQTTNNKSVQQESCQRGWRLFSIVAAYFVCSDTLKAFLFKYLETAAYDKRRAYHGTATVCLQNLRKTFKYGGRKNVPSVEEITAISAGRNSKRQIYRLPGGTEKVVNTKSTTVVQDVIEELCVMINVTNPLEMEEFSVYCIVEGDTFTMPLAREEYILDVTTELQKNHQVFYLIFCRSVWSYPLRLDSQLYVEVVFNQIAPDYLEGLLLVMPGETLEQEFIYDIAKIAALLHRAADMTHVPTMKETKFLLPKPALSVRDVKPSHWVNMVQSNWQECENMTTIQAKAQFLDVLSKWPLFGSSFFAVKKASEPKERTDHILALNRNGVHFYRPCHSRDAAALPVLGGDIDEEGQVRGRNPLPGHEVRQPDAAAHHPTADGPGARDIPTDQTVHHDAAADECEPSSGTLENRF
ncbi:UNVERIFIED_CONTAM: hypothetical protein PYX00_000382 [Menopon gallinae]|uniref:Unconventional myosin-XV n=1 Tax=Menopon gallinae TaxID=328185 RepID=A0AAW2I8X8_9NEOP